MTQEQEKKFKYWQWRTIIGTMVGYIFFYLVRKNFSFAMPGLTAEYGITKTQLGAILTIAGLIYGVSKFVNGMLADHKDGRWHMVTGLTVCTITSFILGMSANIAEWITGANYGASFVNVLVIIISILWIINNMFQGCGFPPCNRLITHWVPSTELATKMSIWNTSHSIGAGIAGILCGILIMGGMGIDMTGNPETVAHIAENIGQGTADSAVLESAKHVGAWKWAFLIPAFIGAFGVVFLIWTLRDTPKSVGLPELDKESAKSIGKKEDSAELNAYIKEHVFKNPIIWMLAIADFFVYVIRFAVLDWGPTFLREARGLSAAEAGWTVVIFEIFGVIGMLGAGWITDKVFGSRGTRTCVLCMLGAIASIIIFCLLPATTSPMILLFVLAFAGMFIYGPQALIGVIASNHATRKAASSANGVIGMVSYISVAISGVGFGFISDHFGWEWVFAAMVLMAVIGLAIFLPMWNMKKDAYGDEETVAE